MKKLLENKWLLLGGLILVLLVNYTTMLGLFGNLSQGEVSDKYVNYLAPAGLTFSIWGIIYIGMGLVVYSEFKHEDHSYYNVVFRKKIKPLMIAWYLFNILWNIFWVTEKLVLAMVMIILYWIVVALICYFIEQEDILYKEAIFLRWPSGFHLGWISFAVFANAMSLITQLGLNSLETFGLILSIALMIVALLFVIVFAMEFSNFMILIPALWGIFGIVLKHLPSSEFVHQNSGMFYASAFMLGVGVFAWAALAFRGDLTRAQLQV